LSEAIGKEEYGGLELVDYLLIENIETRCYLVTRETIEQSQVFGRWLVEEEQKDGKSE